MEIFSAAQAQETLARTWQAKTVSLAAALAAPTGPPSSGVRVYANHGRWVVECPDCHAAQIASKEDKRFMCNGCANVAVAGKWRPVTWPSNDAELAALLKARPSVNQNWVDETVTALTNENKTWGP